MEENVSIKHRKRVSGIVVSDKMEKTIRIKVERVVRHPVFKKQMKKHRNFMAHDENESCSVGDRVLIEETRPISKMKRWKVIEILEKAK